MSRPKGSQNLPWNAMVRKLRAHPDRWMLLPEMRNVPESMVDVIRRRRRRALRAPGGIVRCRVKARVWMPDGSVRYTLILKFETTRFRPSESEDGEA